MSKQLDPLGTTAPELHRFWFVVRTHQQWYDIMRECREWFGKSWRGMSKVRRKLNAKYSASGVAIPVWFEVPDPRFATWISVKHSLQVAGEDKFKAAK